MKKKTIRLILIIILILAFSAAVYCGLNYEIAANAKEAKKIIAIDPGHGGPNEDQKGYPTLDGTPESVINNAVALMLKQILIDRGYEVIFTKEPDDDAFLHLQERPEAANKANADLLISIHHDSNMDENLKGFRVFYSSYKVNLDTKDIVVLYDRKEYTLVSEQNLLDKDNGAYTVKTVTDGTTTFELNSNTDQYKIIDRSPCDAALKSEIFAKLIYEKMSALDYLQPKGNMADTVVDEEYRVLRYADMPSVLIEAGFMSNPAEMLEIQKTENQLALATSIADAIDAYFKK